MVSWACVKVGRVGNRITGGWKPGDSVTFESLTHGDALPVAHPSPEERLPSSGGS